MQADQLTAVPLGEQVSELTEQIHILDRMFARPGGVRGTTQWQAERRMKALRATLNLLKKLETEEYRARG